MPAADNDELPLVMREICDALGAICVFLTVHPEEGAANIVHAEDELGADTVAMRQLLANDASADGHGMETFRWIEADLNPKVQNVFVIPVAAVAGQNRLMISAFFGALSDTERSAVEEVYLRRRPFAVGYFRLWQLDRVRTRRVEALETALNLNDMGVFVLDRSGDLLFANEAGQSILDDGRGLRRHRASLRATHLSDSLRLQVALDHVVSMRDADAPHTDPARRAPLVALQRDRDTPLILSVLPTERTATEPNDAAAIVFVLDPSQDMERLIRPLCALYGLSPVEARLVTALVKGSTIAQASETLQLKQQTARTYLKQIFAKTGTNRQSELIRLMMSSMIHTSRKVFAQVM